MTRGTDNLATTLTPIAGHATHDISGTFHNPELDATLTVIASGGGLYGAFSGELGDGAMVPLLPHGPDVWLLPMPRALDSAAPGDWTLHFTRSRNGTLPGVTVGCWLAAASTSHPRRAHKRSACAIATEARKRDKRFFF
jgi:D-aminopeptidase